MLSKYLQIGVRLEEVPDHVLGSDPLPVQDVEEALGVGDVDGDHGEVAEQWDPGSQGLEWGRQKCY